MLGERYLYIDSEGSSFNSEGSNASLSEHSSEQRRAYVEATDFSTLKRGGETNGYQVEALVFNGGHLFTDQETGEEVPYKRLTFKTSATISPERKRRHNTMRIGVEYSQAPQRELTLGEQFQIAKILTQYPALTLKVLFRRKVGLRRAEPSHILVMALLLYVIGYNTNSPAAGSHGGLMVFAVAMGIAGYWQQFNRWRELRKGMRPSWHTYSEGVSPLEDALNWYMQHKQQRAADAPAEHRPTSGLSATAPSARPCPGAGAILQATRLRKRQRTRRPKKNPRNGS